MDNSSGVRVIQSFRDLLDDLERLIKRQTSCSGDKLIERHTMGKLHDDERSQCRLVLTYIKDGHNARM